MSELDSTPQLQGISQIAHPWRIELPYSVKQSMGQECHPVNHRCCCCYLGCHCCVTSECTALLGQRSGFRGVLDSGFSLWAAPTYYCGSEYFHNQCPQVWNLIGTEHSLNRSEHRVFLSNQKSDSRGIPSNWKLEFRGIPNRQESDYRSWIDVRSDQRSNRQ